MKQTKYRASRALCRDCLEDKLEFEERAKIRARNHLLRAHAENDQLHARVDQVEDENFELRSDLAAEAKARAAENEAHAEREQALLLEIEGLRNHLEWEREMRMSEK